MRTDDAARLHSVLVDLHQRVCQVTQFGLHDLWTHSKEMVHLFFVSLALQSF